MKKVYKYKVDLDHDYTTINLPYGAEVLYAREQFDDIYVWALVDQEEDLRYPYGIRIAGTGHPIDDEGLQYLGSAHLDGGSLIIHVFHWE